MITLRTPHRGWSAACALVAGPLLAAALWNAAPAPVLAHPGVTTSVTWTREVSRIVERRCAHCHREGGAGPMALTSYEAARPWARAIREEVLERRMPPTGIRSGAGLFSNARSLSWAESELLVSWADGGAPEGTASDTMPPRDTVEWTARVLGTPVAASAAEPLTVRFGMPIPPGWLDAWMVEPGAWPVLAAALRTEADEVIGRWTPGDDAVQYPQGAGVRVAQGAPLMLEMTLSRAPDDAAAAPPALQFRTSSGAKVAVDRYLVSSETAAPAGSSGKGETLLGFKLRLLGDDPAAQLVLKRRSGEETFLFAMAAPGVPDPVLYRLRQPLVRNSGDTLEVRTTAPYELEVEAVPTAPSPPRATGR